MADKVEIDLRRRTWVLVLNPRTADQLMREQNWMYKSSDWGYCMCSRNMADQRRDSRREIGCKREDREEGRRNYVVNKQWRYSHPKEI